MWILLNVFEDFFTKEIVFRNYVVQVLRVQ